MKSYVVVPDEGVGEYHVFQTYVILAERRDELLQYLRANEIEALVHYATPIHMQPAAASLNLKPSDFPQTLQLSKRILSLPLYPGMTLEQQDFVVNTIAKFYKS